jgi:hypothetical protein
MRKTKVVRIGESAYKIVQLGTKAGLATFSKLTKVVGPAIGGAITGKDEDGNAGVNAGRLIVAVCEVPYDQLADIVSTFVEQTLVVDEAKGTELKLADIYDLQFAGKFDELLELVKEHLEFNYSSFLGALNRTVRPS